MACGAENDAGREVTALSYVVHVVIRLHLVCEQVLDLRGRHVIEGEMRVQPLHRMPDHRRVRHTAAVVDAFVEKRLNLHVVGALPAISASQSAGVLVRGGVAETRRTTQHQRVGRLGASLTRAARRAFGRR